MRNLKLIVCTLLLLSATVAKAQKNKLELNVGASMGLMLYGGNPGANGGSFKLDAGLNYYFNPNWSLMPGISVWHDFEPIGCGYEGDDDVIAEFLAVPLIMQYHWHHIKESKQKFVFGLGPAFIFCIDTDEYYIDADPRHPLNGRERLKKFSVGLQPSAMYQFNHVRLGIEGNIGLMNVKKNHGISHGSYYLNNVWFRVGWRF